jgi:uncharacterized protein with HEPN domain
MLAFALIKEVEIIGEAAARISRELASFCRETQNPLIHQYLGPFQGLRVTGL